MYRSLAGIAPASAGYGTVTVAPKVSPTLDPAAVNASVATVRGVVTSSWTRHSVNGCVNGITGHVTLRIGVPVGMLGEVHVPLLGEPASKAVATPAIPPLLPFFPLLCACRCAHVACVTYIFPGVGGDSS